jgi:hypothetical protein
LIRNTPSFDVIFETDLFIPESNMSNEDFIESLNRQEAYSNNKILSYTRATEGENDSIQWNFWTPRIPNYDGYNVSESCNWWLIYDPCIVLWEPIKANGGMNFWTQKYN